MEQRGRKKQGTKAKNRIAYRVHFHIRQKIPKNLKKEPRVALWQLHRDVLPRRHSTLIPAFSRRNSLQGSGKSLVGYGENGL